MKSDQQLTIQLSQSVVDAGENIERLRKEAERAKMRKRRQQAKKSGLCVNCRIRAAVLQRNTCRDCLMVASIKESFKFDRHRKFPGLTKIRGSCYVEWFKPDVRRLWIKQVTEKWTGRCFYTGLPIEIGSTAGLDHMLPVSRAAAFGPRKVFHPDNLVWSHKSINILKGEKTADEFLYWLKTDFRQSLEAIGRF